MLIEENPNWFTNSPLARLNTEEDNDAFVRAQLKNPDALFVALWQGQPLIAGGAAAMLSGASRSEFPASAQIVFLGLEKKTPVFAVDFSDHAQSPDAAPFADLGEYKELRMAASEIPRNDLAIIGHARWLFEWHKRHQFCPSCGGRTDPVKSGAKRHCETCEIDHFPRTNPVAIVLAVHEDACLLGRGPHFPPGFLSALAGFIEASETPEEAAKRELFEEAGVTLTDIRYQFSQPWPFPDSMMMGFIADATSRDLTLDKKEIEEARWVDRETIIALQAGEERDGIFLPPKFTIARQLLERWITGEHDRQ